MSDAKIYGVNLWWVIMLGTLITLSLALGFTFLLLYHERTKRRLERESDDRYRELFHNVNDLIYIHSPEGTLLQINKSVTHLLGLPEEMIIGQSIAQFLPRGYKKYFQEYLQNIQSAQKSDEVTGLFPFVTRSIGTNKYVNDPIFIEYRSRIVYHDEEPGKIKLIWGIARDQSVRIRQDKSLKKSAQKLQVMYYESEKMRSELSLFSQKMIQHQEEDRLRISRELHDEVGQTLTAVSTNLEIAKQDITSDQTDLRRRLVESQTLTQEITRRIKNVIKELRPIAIEELGLFDSLSQYICEFETRTGIRTSFEYDPLEDDLSLNEKVTIYRIFQEWLTNIARHSGATEARVLVFDRQDVGESRAPTGIGTTYLEVYDNGKGIKSSSVQENVELKDIEKGSFGLIGIQERVNLHDGTFRILSNAHEGTRIKITIPRKRYDEKTLQS